MTTAPTLPPAFWEKVKRDDEMRRNTNDEMVQRLWECATDGQSQLFFVLDAQITWKTDHLDWHDFHLGHLSPDTCDPPGSGFKEPLLSGWQRWHQLGCRVGVEPIVLADAKHSRQVILTGIRKAQTLADLVSLVSFQPVRLRAARRQEAPWGPLAHEAMGQRTPPSGKTHFIWPFDTAEESENTAVTDEWLNNALRPFVHALLRIPDEDVRWTIQNAINWHAQANLLQGIGRYIHYWAAFELLGSFFYEYLEPGHLRRRTNSEIEADLLKCLLDLDSKNYRSKLVECNRLLNPTARDKILALSRIVLPQDPDIRRVLFDKPRNDKGQEIEGIRNMYEIRNDIAHGNISGLLREYLDQNAERLRRFQDVSAKFILAVLNHAVELCNHRNPAFRPGAARNSTED